MRNQQDKEKVSPLLLAEFSPSRPPFNPSVASASLCVPPSFPSYISPLVLHLPTPPPPLCPFSSVVRHVCNLLFLILRVTLTHPCLISTLGASHRVSDHDPVSFPRAPFTHPFLPQVAMPAVLARSGARGTTQMILNPPANTASPSASIVLMITSQRNAGHLICTKSRLP